MVPVAGTFVPRLCEARCPHDPGPDVEVLLREPVDPHVRRLDDVIVDADDLGECHV